MQTAMKETFESILNKIQENLETPTDDLTPAELDELQENLLTLVEKSQDKIDNFAEFVKKSLAISAFYKEEAKRIENKAKAIEKRIDYLKGYYTDHMVSHALDKINGKVYKLALRNYENTIVTPNLNTLPPEYVKIKKEPNKIAIKEALKNGVVIDGCEIRKIKKLIIS